MIVVTGQSLVKSFFYLQPAVEGILGLSWGFGLPEFDVVNGTAIDYMHCICEGVVEQHLNMWFTRTKENTSFPCFIGHLTNEVDLDLLTIKPTSEITRKPRKIVDRKDWKGNFLNAITFIISRLQ